MRRHPFHPLRWTLALAASFGVVAFTHAQPTGNPKGTLPVPEASAPKPNATRDSRAQRASNGSNDGKLVGTEAQTRARLQSGASPGSGTEGGLPRKQSGSAPGGDAARSDRGSAAPRPMPPSK